ncbi:hypothetical protein V8D89_002150 [Ganoderma adspersum]
MSVLLPFHTSVLEKIHDPATSELVLLARGLGLRRVLCKLLQIYDSPHNLVLLVNATPEEEAAIGEELGILGCRNPGLRIVAFETGRKDRQDLYKKGGLVSITSQIFTVDMLTSDIPTHLITGILILHAERVTPTSAEAFIVRLYREKNKKGFLKAFSDQPEHITSGMSPLRTIMKELQLRTVHIYPRFHVDIKESLDSKTPDIVELHQEMTESMSEIHSAIVQCMTTTLAELKRANTMFDLDDLSIDNAYFRSFDMIVRRILDPVWHKVGPRTKQLVSDLATLRRLLSYLLTYDGLAFHAYLETLIASNTTSGSGAARQHQSPWMLTDAANIIFQYAKRRCYLMTAPTKPKPAVVNLIDEEDEWAILDEIEAEAEGRASGSKPSAKGKEREVRPSWLPDGMEPVLEELPKWGLLADVLHEVEEEMIRRAPMLSSHSPGTDTVLVMASSLQTCTLIKDFLDGLESDAPRGAQGRRMMEDKLRLYLWWKGKLSERKAEGKGPIALPKGKDEAESGVSEGLKKKDRDRQDRQAKRRRVRGGGPAVGPGRDEAASGGGGGVTVAVDLGGRGSRDRPPGIHCTGDTTLYGGYTVQGIHCTGDTTLYGGYTVQGIHCTGDTTLYGGYTVQGIHCTGDTTLYGGYTVQGIHCTGDTTLYGGYTVQGIHCTGDTTLYGGYTVRRIHSKVDFGEGFDAPPGIQNWKSSFTFHSTSAYTVYSRGGMPIRPLLPLPSPSPCLSSIPAILVLPHS